MKMRGKQRVIDWNLVEDFEDIKAILKALDIVFVGEIKGLREIEYLLKDLDDNEDINPNKWEA